MERDPILKITYFSPLLQLLMVMFCPLIEGRDQIVNRFEGALDGDVLLGEVVVVTGQGLFRWLVYQGYAVQVLFPLFRHRIL